MSITTLGFLSCATTGVAPTPTKKLDAASAPNASFRTPAPKSICCFSFAVDKLLLAKRERDGLRPAVELNSWYATNFVRPVLGMEPSKLPVRFDRCPARHHGFVPWFKPTPARKRTGTQIPGRRAPPRSRESGHSPSGLSRRSPALPQPDNSPESGSLHGP